MNHTLSTWSIVAYIESNIQNDIRYDILEKITGFSYRHLRTIFKQSTGITLANYIRHRRITNAAFDLIHTSLSITEISYKYNFSSYDVFARAFKDTTGLSPKSFRQKNIEVGHGALIMGIYAPKILNDHHFSLPHSHIKEIYQMHTKNNSPDSILLGVPKVTYTFEECTPLILSIKAALNYLGDSIDYGYILAASGAAFRLRWNEDDWDLGNINCMNTYEHPFDILNHIFNAVNRKYKLYLRSDATKDDYKTIIKNEIDAGRPLIALGIIGPPEACIITGYQKDGDTLLGWNCFQENKEFANGISFHECGYFITNQWWENPSTTALISIGDKNNGYPTQKALINNAIKILSANTMTLHHLNQPPSTYACGQAAYILWRKKILDDSEFNHHDIVPLKVEKLMCQGDAQAVVGEGRSYAAHFLNWIGNTNKNIKKICSEASQHFKAAGKSAIKMYQIRGGYDQSEKVLNMFATHEVRLKLAQEIEKARNHELKALELLKLIYKEL